MVVYLPDKDYNLPNLDILTLLYDSPESWSKDDTVLHAEADRPSNCITKAEARTLTKRLSYVFRHEFGIGSTKSGQDVVVCMLSGQVLAPVVFSGIIGAGGVYSAASPAFSAYELARQIKQGNGRVLVVSPDCRDVGLKAAKECNLSPDHVLVLNSMEGARELFPTSDASTDYLQVTKELEWERVVDPATLRDRLICLLYSSGTTGPPKGVHISHQNVVSVVLIMQYENRQYYYKKRRTDPSYELSWDAIGHLPVNHIAGVSIYFLLGPTGNGTTYWMPKFDFPKFIEHVKKYKIAFLITVPPIYLLIAKSPLVKDHFKTMETAQSCAAPLGPELQALAETRLGCPITQVWGLSETTGSFTQSPRDWEDPTGSLSPQLPNTRLRIVDDQYNDVKEGEEGEFILKAPTVTKGYHNNDKANAEAFTQDGWFKTGDVGVRRNGKLYIVDRKKELIKYKALQVAPAELEALLLSHELILDAAVIGINDPSGSGNELPRAYVVADPKKITGQKIKEYVKSRVANHKQLRGGVVFISAIPKSPSGKILRRELRELAKSEKSHATAKL